MSRTTPSRAPWPTRSIFMRMSFALAQPGPGEGSGFLSVEEGTFVNGKWVMARRWNGDQTDYGLNLDAPTLLKVRLGTFR